MPDPIVLSRLARIRGATARSTTWWGRAFVRSFEELTLEADDLGNARSLARSGRLGAIVVLEAMASAVLDPGTENPLMAQVKVERLDAESLDHVRPRGRTRERACGCAGGRRAARRPGRARRRGRRGADPRTRRHRHRLRVRRLGSSRAVHALALLYQLAWQVDRDPYVLMLLRGRTREALLAEVAALASGAQAPGAEEREEVRVRAAQVLALAEDAPSGHGLADAAVAAYDEAVSRLL